MHAKRTIKKFDQIKEVLTIKFMSLGYTMVTLRSETLPKVAFNNSSVGFFSLTAVI